MRLKHAQILIGTYLLVAFVLIPLMTPLRQLGTATPGLIRAAVIPPLIFLIILSLGRNLTKLNSMLMPVLLLTFLQAAIVGLWSGPDFDLRSYLSHLFQLFSAYVMLVCGMTWSDSLGIRFWKRFSFMALLSVSVSSLTSISLWLDQEIGRLYTPAYVLVFVSAVSLSMHPKGKLQNSAAVLMAVVSNKRGPLISVLVMICAAITSRFAFWGTGGSKIRKNSIILAFSLALVLLLIAPLLPILLSEEINHPFMQAFTKTTERLFSLFATEQDQISFNAASAGRIEEIDLALNSLRGADYFFGRGAGWTEITAYGKGIHNIHFTPISLLTVFGFPFAIFVYAYAAWLIVSMLKWILANGSHTEKVALFYLIGSLVHTMTAYSLFVDLLNFFFLGVLARAHTRRKRHKYQIEHAVNTV